MDSSRELWQTLPARATICGVCDPEPLCSEESKARPPEAGLWYEGTGAYAVHTRPAPHSRSSARTGGISSPRPCALAHSTSAGCTHLPSNPVPGRCPSP